MCAKKTSEYLYPKIFSVSVLCSYFMSAHGELYHNRSERTNFNHLGTCSHSFTPANLLILKYNLTRQLIIPPRVELFQAGNGIELSLRLKDADHAARLPIHRRLKSPDQT